MKRSGLIFKVFLILLSSFLVFSCESKNKDADRFLIKVDSIQVPSEVTMDVPFTIAFFGTIGTNGCYEFSDVVVNHSGHEIQIETWGTIDKSGEPCPAVMVYLTGITLDLTIDYPGVYHIKILQPDKSFIEKDVTVYFDVSDL